METEIVPICPTCKSKLNCVGVKLPDAPPVAGEYSICFNCGEFLVFTEPPQVRQMEFSEEVRMDDNLLDAMKHMRAKVVQKRAYKDFVKNFHKFGI